MYHTCPIFFWFIRSPFPCWKPNLGTHPIIKISANYINNESPINRTKSPLINLTFWQYKFEWNTLLTIALIPDIFTIWWPWVRFTSHLSTFNPKLIIQSNIKASHQKAWTQQTLKYLQILNKICWLSNIHINIIHFDFISVNLKELYLSLIFLSILNCIIADEIYFATFLKAL